MRDVTAKIEENVLIAEDTYALTFSAEEMPVRAGQFCMVGIEGFPLRRPIAICKAAGTHYTVCYQIRGAGTGALSLRKAGDTLSVLLPLGNGFPAARFERIALVGGGAGVFPLVAALKERGGRGVFAYMGSKNSAHVCMTEEFKEAEKFVLCTDDGSAGRRGNAVQAMLEDVPFDAVFACGPLPMLRALKEGMRGTETPVYVSLEERMGCGVGACLVCVCDRKDGTHARVCKDGPVFPIDEVEV